MLEFVPLKGIRFSSNKLFNPWMTKLLVVTQGFTGTNIPNVSVCPWYGNIVHFLSPYSPDLTPIELFSKVKGLIQTTEMEMNSLQQASE